MEQAAFRGRLFCYCVVIATKAAISLEEHLRTPYEHEPEYVDGELEERPLGTIIHGELQSRISAALRRAGFRTAGSEITVQITPTKTRIPDVIAFAAKRREYHPSTPPDVAVEILSPGDSVEKVLVKFREYAQFGVPHIWLVVPESMEFFVYSSGRLLATESFVVAEPKAVLTKDEMFEDL